MARKMSQELTFSDNIYDVIRGNIKKYRLKKGMTSAKLADLIGLSHDFVRQIQSDKTRYNFSVETLYKISVALGVKIDDLVKKQDTKK